MTIKLNLRAAAVALGLLAATSAFAGTANLGDAAPALQVAEWVKGGPVDLAAGKGKKIFVVEFWATWCPPCRASIPHLTELQKKYKDKDVVFVGLSDEEPSVVKPFVQKMGEKMEYAVAIDKDKKTSAGYMEAFGIDGIPHSFVVDKAGKIIWQGHPMDRLDETLQQIIDGKYDLGIAKKRMEAQQLLEEFAKACADDSQKARADELAKTLEALDKEVGGIMNGQKFDAQQVRRQVQFNTTMQQYARALMSGKDGAALADLEKKLAPLSPPGFDLQDYRESIQTHVAFRDYLKLAQEGADAEKLKPLADRLWETKTKNPQMLNEIAWKILTEENLKYRDVKLAVKLAKGAFDGCDGKDAAIVDTYARALFDNGDVKEAIEHQKKAIALCEDPDMKSTFSATLREYEGKLAPK